MKSPSVLLRRVLALAILASVITALAAVTLRPVMSMRQARHATIERSLKLLAGYQRLAATRPDLEEQLRGLRSSEAVARGIVDGSSAALAAASLQSEIRPIIEGNGGEIRSVQPIPPSKAGDFEKIELRYDLSIAQVALPEVMSEIEIHTPYLFLDGIDIRGVEGLLPASQGDQDPKLTVRWTVHAYRGVAQK